MSVSESTQNLAKAAHALLDSVPVIRDSLKDDGKHQTCNVTVETRHGRTKFVFRAGALAARERIEITDTGIFNLGVREALAYLSQITAGLRIAIFREWGENNEIQDNYYLEIILVYGEEGEDAVLSIKLLDQHWRDGLTRQFLVTSGPKNFFEMEPCAQFTAPDRAIDAKGLFASLHKDVIFLERYSEEGFTQVRALGKPGADFIRFVKQYYAGYVTVSIIYP